MVPLPQVFKHAATEFSVENYQPPKPNRQWVKEAEQQLSSGKPEYPAHVVDPKPSFNVTRLMEYLHLSHTSLRQKLYKLYDHPDFHAIPDESMCAERDRVMRMWSHIVSLGVIHNSVSSNAPEGRARYDAVIEACGLISHSLDIKMSVHYGLFGGTISMMGDDAQAREWTPLVEKCEMLGCFALTELGHGSNVKGIETIAEYDVENQEFIIHTPHEQAQKYWIGGAAISARWTAAFAQLYVDGICHGIHPFLVRVRHDNGTVVRGVQLADCGHKCGMNGVDNGRIWFNNVRIPHNQLLRRHSQVSLDGKYTSQFKSADERFGVSLASLSGGRISVASGALNQAKIGLSIAIRYSLTRRAFGPPGKPETRLLDYPLHQRRLIPLLATTVTMQIIHNRLKYKWHHRENNPNTKEIHLWSSGFKALMSWHTLSTLQEAREACGGQGYKAENRLGELKSSHDVALTYEGDNHILLQAVTKTMLAEFMNGARNMEFKGHFSYLKDPVALRDTKLEDIDVRDLERFGIVVLRRREAAVYAKLAAALQKRGKVGMSGLEAFNECAELVEEAGKAHTDLLMVEVLLGELDMMVKNGDTDVAGMVRTCGQLFMLSLIHEQSSFLRVGALNPKDAERVNVEISALCKELRPQVLHLVNSFGLPPHVLSPIAFDYLSHNGRARI